MCDFHRVQAWHRWLIKLTNGVPEESAGVLKTLLEEVALSTTEELYLLNKQKLMGSEPWRSNLKFQNYMNQTWFTDNMCKVSYAP